MIIDMQEEFSKHVWREIALLWKRLYELKDCPCKERDDIWLQLEEYEEL